MLVFADLLHTSAAPHVHPEEIAIVLLAIAAALFIANRFGRSRG